MFEYSLTPSFNVKLKFLFKEGLSIVGASLFLGLLAQISLPLGPVPLSLQTFGIYLIGVFLGKKRGLAVVTAYLIEGSLGFPVFAGGSFGISHLFGLTGGYLLAFLPAVFLAGRSLTGRFFYSSIIKHLIASALTIFFFGSLPLIVVFGIRKAFSYGIIPFIIPEIVKIAMILCIIKGCRRSGIFRTPWTS